MSTLEGIESDRLVETVATAWEREYVQQRMARLERVTHH